ncbi:methionyl-tRNA formyltransferase [Permianibacter aggregans]|uniref:Methionyl-tRNA formyltransferase n=1 Tax=Permianibacter aggregans TaxID=1510150 RepID=A0A4R6UHE3_9GAMM|nr:methionyl-tRNA formyltransferase [Permianibacter aggregans]QGX39913.1 methionyl-tRNA formyltransferase [Permianibacter aggregans]TDQ46281.1 methionyl-tRNA formyltransferase [Permianibacter aggregans]
MASNPTAARIAFAGTPEFAAVHLQALLDAGFEPAVVYTQPDRPAGRGQQLQASPVKQLALTHNIPVEQPLSLKLPEAQAQLADYQLDLLIVVAYGLLLPQAVLDTPKLGCVNVHGSLLPRWRGAAPIQRAILAGDHETGVGLMQMEAGLDTGPVLAEARLEIEPNDTGGSLHDKLAALGAKLLVEQLPALLAGKLEPRIQPDTDVTYAKKLEKAESQINWQQTADQIDRQIRAFNPWPVAQTTVAGQALRVWAAQPIPETYRQPAGNILLADPGRLLVACGSGVLAITEAQLAGGKRLPVRDLLNARRALFLPGTILGATS